MPVVVSLVTYTNSSTEDDTYSRDRILDLISSVDVVDVLATQALVIQVLCEEMTEAGKMESPEKYLQGLGTHAYRIMAEMDRNEG